MSNETCIQASRNSNSPLDFPVCEDSLPPVRLEHVSLAEFSRRAFGELTHANLTPRWSNPIAYTPFGWLPFGCNSTPPEGSGDSSTGPRDAGSGSEDGDLPPPVLEGFSVHATVPCGAGAMITDLDEDLGVCANYTNNNHHLFSWNPLVNSMAASIIPLTYPPDQVLRSSSGEIYITTHENPGLAVVNPIEGTEANFAFPLISLPGATSGGRSVSSFPPSFAKGMVEIGNQIFVATSNYDTTFLDYHPGSVLVFERDTGNFTALSTQGFNPTSVAHAGLLWVVSSGAVSRQGEALTDAYLEGFDPTSLARIRSIPLGRTAAGISGEIAFSADGSTAVLPTGDNSGRLLVVDLLSGTSQQISLRGQGISGTRVLLSNISLTEDGRHALASNFNDGKAYLVDLETGMVLSQPIVLDGNTLDAEGLSDGLRSGQDIYLGLGPQILRLSFH